MTTRSPSHAAPARSPLFRLSLRMPWRKPAAVPAVFQAAGAAAPDAARYACCEHCQGMCAHPDNHPTACTEGCNVPAWLPAPPGASPADLIITDEWLFDDEPVLGDSMLSDVRREWDDRPRGGLTHAQQRAHADAMHKLNARYLPPARYANGRNDGTQPRQQPVYGERPQRDVLAAERLAFVRDAAQAAGKHDRIRYRPVSVDVLEQVLAGLRKL